MLYYAVKLSSKHDGTSYRAALITAFSICGVFVLTAIPNMVRMMLPPLGQESPAFLEILNGHIYLINASCNAIIFTGTNRRFRKFIFRRFLKVFYSRDSDDAIVCYNTVNTRTVVSRGATISAISYADRCTLEQ